MSDPENSQSFDLPANNSCYNKVDYWDARYEKEETYDWCKKYKDFKHLLSKEITVEDYILILGCGNSSLSEDLFTDGYHNITNIDYSEVVISKMVQRSKISRQMTWLVMDATDLNFGEKKFDVVLEKATLDSLLVDEKDPWKITKGNQVLLDKIMIQISNILAPNGRFLSLTFTQPHFRRTVYCHPEYGWSFSCHSYGDGIQFFLYIMTKGQELHPKHIENRKLASNIAHQVTYISDTDDEDFIMKIGVDL